MHGGKESRAPWSGKDGSIISTMKNWRVFFGGGGEKVSLRIVAQHVDEWHYFGTPEQLKHKASVLDDWCAKVGRDPAEITRCIAVGHGLDEGAALEEFVAVGFTHFIAAFNGPEWDLRPLERLLALLKAPPSGLSAAEAEARLTEFGLNDAATVKRSKSPR